MDINSIVKSALSRRSFMAGAGSVAAASVLAGCSDNGTVTAPTPTTSLTDADIINFALNVEYTEASIHLFAATGSGLSAADMGSGAGTVTGGSKIPNLTPLQASYVNAMAEIELSHVRVLRAALGSAAIPMPNIDLVNSFNSIAQAAGVSQSYTPFDTFGDWLITAETFEDVGVTAYTGAAPLLSSAANLAVAAGIQGAEAYNGGMLRTLILAQNDTDLLLNTNRVISLRASLGGGNETPLSYTSVVPTNSASIAYGRTPSQVLHILYGTGGGAGVSTGGFFPNGVNGTIKTTTA